jgi:hypothetical protein
LPPPLSNEEEEDTELRVAIEASVLEELAV